MKPEKQQNVFEDMEDRYESGYVQDIRDRLMRCEAREVQYLEMKQMMDILYRFRGRVKMMVSHYRRWKVDYENETDEIEKVYRAYEGIFIRRQFHDSWKLYVTVNRDYHEMRRTYLASLRQPPPQYATSW